MHKKYFVFGVLAILVTMAGGCIPNFIQPIKLSTAVDPLEDPVIAVDLDGNSHIVGVSNEHLVYQRIDQLGNIDRTEIIENPESGYTQHKPDIAVTEDGTAWIVWYEEYDTEKFAMFTQILPSDDFDGLYYYLDGYEHSSGGFVNVVARFDAVYAVFDRINSITDYVGVILYENLISHEKDVVYSYDSLLEMGELYSLDLAIDSHTNLHIVYHDKLVGPERHRLRYNSNATTLPDGTMNQMWEIGWIQPGPITVAPKLSIHQFTTSVDSVIMAASVTDRFVASCEALGCDLSTRVSELIPSTLSIDVTEFDILGYATTLGYAVSFIGKDTGEIYPQVYQWLSNNADITQITDTETNKSNISMVYGFQPVIGFIEHKISYGPPPLHLPFESTIVTEHDTSNGLRTIFQTTCPLISDDRKLDMAANLNLAIEIIPVAGVWNICNETWFSTNAFINYMPLILR